MATIRERLENWEATQASLQAQISDLTQKMSALSERLQDNPQATSLATELEAVRAELGVMQEDLRKANILAEHYRERLEKMEPDARNKTAEIPPPPPPPAPGSAADTPPTADANGAPNGAPRDQASPQPPKKRQWL